MIRFLTKHLSLVLLAAVSLNVEAAWYQVEMVVFEHINPALDGEVWPHNPGLAPLAGSVELLPPAPEVQDETPVDGLQEEASPFVAYQTLPPERHRLEGIFRVLRYSREYRPLYHLSWQQPGLDGDRARAVHMQMEDPAVLYPVTMPPLLMDRIPADFYEPVKLLFDGTLKIRSSLFLHVDMDMVLFRSPQTVPAPEQPVTDSGERLLPEPDDADYVRLTETRRIKLNELHYFDHPLFGVILQVSRFGGD